MTISPRPRVGGGGGIARRAQGRRSSEAEEWLGQHQPPGDFEMTRLIIILAAAVTRQGTVADAVFAKANGEVLFPAEASRTTLKPHTKA
jgi:hypothetical protein